MVLLEWLNIDRRNPNPYKFQVIDISENDIDREGVAKFCAEELITAFRSFGFLRNILNEYRLSALLDYITNNVFAPEGTGTWFGDFGEVLCAAILRDCDGHTIPIYKLHGREKQNWSMRLTDILTYKEVDDAVLIYFSEVITRSTRNVKRDVIKAKKDFKKLQNDMVNPKPEVLDFIQRRLYDIGEYEKADLFMRIYFGDVKPDKYSILFLVYELRVWDEEVLTNLNDEFNLSDNTRFGARVVLISELRGLIRKSYACTKTSETVRGLSGNG